MQFSRRKFLQGSAATLIGGVALVEAEKIGILYFFPQTIRVAQTLAESNYFSKVEELVDSEQEFSSRFWKKASQGHQSKLIRQEIYDPVDFLNRGAMPIRVEYKRNMPTTFLFHRNAFSTETPFPQKHLSHCSLIPQPRKEQNHEYNTNK